MCYKVAGSVVAASLHRMSFALITTATVALLSLAFSHTPALAHAGIVGREPDEGASLSRPPEQVRLTFNEPVDATFDPLKVFDSSGERVDRNDARTVPGQPEIAEVDLQDLAPGSYTVEYRITSVDGHVIDGDYDFTIAEAGEPGNAARADDGSRQQAQPAEQEEPSRQQSAGDNTTLYSLLSVGGLGVIVLAALGVRSLRQRKP